MPAVIACPVNLQFFNIMVVFAGVGGPSALLQVWVQSRSKVKVITRSFKSVRGTCIGFIIAFDRYWNLVIVKPILFETTYTLVMAYINNNTLYIHYEVSK